MTWGVLGIANGKGGAEAGAFGYEHGLACFDCDAAVAAAFAAVVDLEDDAALDDAYPLVVVQGQPGLACRG